MERQPVTTLLIGLGGSGAWTLVHVKRQLFDIYDNRIPKNVALTVFDTSRNNIPSIGTERNIREEGMGVGKTALKESEYVTIGGNAYSIAEDIAAGNRPHMQWFNAKWFLTNLPKENFNIDIGAGMYRQFGRLAFFRDVESPNISGIANVLDNRLRELYRERHPNSPAITVIIIGSLVGGTGAGTFIDTAHIIQRVAETNNIEVNINGFFYLPQAFKAVLDSGKLQAAHVRAFAALRELSRFKTNKDYEYGYPMYYQNARTNINPQVWYSTNRGKLYSMIYLIDGEGQGLKMNDVPVKDGVAPVVADAIIAMIDPEYGKKYQEDAVNVANVQQTNKQVAGFGAYVSTLGTYSIILPIQQIIEGWAHQFAEEMLNIIAPPEDERNGVIFKLSAGHNPQYGIVPPSDEAKRLLTANVPMTSPKDPKRTIMGMTLWNMLYGVYNASLGNVNTTLNQLRAQQIGYWLSALIPPTNQADQDTQRVINETGGIINEKAEDVLIVSSARQPKGDPSKDCYELVNLGKRFIDKQLGVVVAGGGRRGGSYENALNKFIELHLTRYKHYMTAYIFNELNGTQSKSELEAKQGRLGWVIAVCEELKGIFSQAYETLSRVITGAGDAFAQTQRTNVENQLANVQKEMIDKREQGRAMFGEPPAIQAQRSFISSVQYYVEFYRREFTIEAIVTIVREFRNFTEKLLDELYRWAKIIAFDPNSLYARIRKGREDVASDRIGAKNVANHFVIDDPDWERARYNTYVRDEVRQEFAKVWEWSAELKKVDGVETVVIDVKLGDQPLVRNMLGKWSDDNLDVLLEYCRNLFRRSLSDVTLLEYLRINPKFAEPKQVADLLYKNMGYLLAFEQDATTSIQNILLAQHGGIPEAQQYLQNIYFALEEKRGAGGKGSQSTYSFADPFRLTMLSLVESINMQKTSSYQDSQKTYLGYAYDYRQLNHLFLAEINAVDYERRLTIRFKRPMRLLQDRVVLMLENREDLLSFLILLCFGVIKEFTYEEAGSGVRYYYAVECPAQERRRQGEIDEWHLTDTITDPKLIDAAGQYVLRGTDFRNEQNPIPKEQIKEYLRHVQDTELEDRVQRDQLALNDRELREWLETGFMPPLDADGNEDLSNWTEEDDEAFIRVARRVMIYDIFTDIASYMQNEMLKKLEERLEKIKRNTDKDTNQRMEEELHIQEEIDFYTVSILMLEDEAEKYRENVRRDFEAKTGKRYQR